MTKKALLAAAAMIALTACTGQQLGKAQMTAPDSTEFDNALAAGYLRLAQAEQKEGDYKDADYFALQSMAAASPTKVVPLPEVTTRNLPKADAFYVGTAREELSQALDGGARVRAPQLAAAAQVSYECWIQELEENNQPPHIAACRDQLDGLIPALQNAIASADAAPAKKAKPPKGKTFVVSFPTGGATLDAAANAVLTDAVKYSANFSPVQVVVSGYTDTVGSAASNDTLSKRRAAVVSAALRIRGISRDNMKMDGYGEEFLSKRTADGVDEAKNRRVEVSVAP
ncbi:MAG: OmpA family protein [Rhodospirillaceae bacterium]|jgi:outer membrane protein OmpA-like peptidoglycan-associated protein|nr:OmpA family protein [Rhodospirillaceae bacterium]MBT3810019.1 OmpA family protein [Rhodospirillaceae bacterium]MBT3929470.1 OmpA family protein [Rhodospirillaceae bacterium]MBT4773443.1 OmpA family protein [Rhodospirillaceae bacterium]MBT5359941.1 OmpA family protein [Rhodospirillaceae bacterium]